ncbi:putative MORN repeat [Leishmania naiffi]|uniref:MORN repeat n=1 Tax=Leishmania naiffi TaxID=5678 RepID=A0AAW3BYG2_9TRYP
MSTEPAFDASHTDFMGYNLAPDFAAVVEASERTGVGYMQYSNGVIYEGDWLNGERHGLGVCYYPSGNIFVGQFRSGMMEGMGTMFFATGECFSGEFRHSSIYKGVYSCRGDEICGTWKDGKRVSEMPSKAPEVLQRARAALFSTIVEQVNMYLWQAASNPTKMVLPASPEDKILLPPLDILSSNTDADAAPATSLQHLVATPNFRVGGQSFVSTRICNNSIGEGDTTDGLRGATTEYGSPNTVFTCAAPSPGEIFFIWRFTQRCFVFLFPFLSLPWMPVAPLRITSLHEEREFVVSGAALRSDFDAPSFSICAIAVAMMCHITSIVIVATRVPLGRVQDGRLTLPEMVVPCVLWLVVALVGASYISFFRFPHGLERVDRRLTPKLSALAASLVDAKASVCIFTYDDNGRGKVMNRHYKYRWLLFAVVLGSMMSLSAPATRGGYGHQIFGSEAFEKAAAVLAFFATFLFSSTLTFLVLKMTDMQREVRAKLHVMTNLAFLERRCLISPSKHMNMAFHLDERFDATNLFSGFPGWYSLRSLILYASACANHRARRTSMGIFWFVLVCAFIVGLLDMFYIAPRVSTPGNRYYSTAHSYALFTFLFWGVLLHRYLYVCVSTRRELRQHLYIIDIAGLYQRVKLDNSEASEIIQQCSRITERNDAEPEIFPQVIYNFVVVLTVLLNMGALAAICYRLSQAIYH